MVLKDLRFCPLRLLEGRVMAPDETPCARSCCAWCEQDLRAYAHMRVAMHV